MPRCLLAACLLAPAASLLYAQEPQKAVEIVSHGHSFFAVRSTAGTTVAFDPHLIEAYGRLPGITADLVLLSHPHSDHTQVAAVENVKKAVVIPGWRGQGFRADWNLVDRKVKDVSVRSVGLYHDESQGMENGKNTAFVIEVDGWKIAHLGDVGHTLTPRQVQEIGPVDVLMLPVGGIYTLNGAQAREVVNQLKPKEYILPMHYGTPVFDEVLTPEEFLEDFPGRQVAKMDTNRLQLNRDPNRPRPLVVLMHWWPKEKK